MIKLLRFHFARRLFVAPVSFHSHPPVSSMCKRVCDKAVNKFILYTINFLLLLGGAVLIGTSTWGVRNNAELSNAIPPSGVTLILVAGVFLVVLSIAGIVGVCFKTKRFGRWFLVLYAMTLIVAIVCEIVGAGIVLQALGKFSTSWTADVEKDTVATWINETWVDCCQFPNGTERVQYVCWTALNTDAVNVETCASGPLFRKAFVDWITTKLTPAGAVGLTLFLLQFIACITAFCFLCRKHDLLPKRRPAGAAHAPLDDADTEEIVLEMSSKSKRSRKSKLPVRAPSPDTNTDVSSPEHVRVSKSRYRTRSDSDEESPHSHHKLKTRVSSKSRRSRKDSDDSS